MCFKAFSRFCGYLYMQIHNYSIITCRFPKEIDQVLVWSIQKIFLFDVAGGKRFFPVDVSLEINIDIQLTNFGTTEREKSYKHN